MSPSWAAQERPWVVALVLSSAAVFAAVFAVILYQRGVDANPFPSYIAGEPPYQVVRYSAPWIAGGIALGGLAVLLLVAAAKRLLRGAARSTAAVAVPDLPPYPLPGLPGLPDA